MSNKGIERPDHTVQVTHAMIDELDRRLGWRDEPRSYRLLMAVLHALWDWSSANEPTDITAGLPIRLCGTNYEQWPSSWTAIGNREVTDFFAHVDLWFQPNPLEDPPTAILAVFDLLSEKAGDREIEDLRRVLPVELQQVWPPPLGERDARSGT